MAIRSFQQHHPKLGARAFVDRSAVVLGDVEIGEDSSVWPLVVVRGDMHRIRIGARTSVQDASVLHITVNLSGQSVPFVAPLAQPVLFQTPPDMILDVQQHQRLVPYSALVSLVPPPTLSPLMESAHE